MLQPEDVLSLQVSLPSKSHSRPHLEALLKAWRQSKAGAAGGHSCTGSMAGFLGEGEGRVGAWTGSHTLGGPVALTQPWWVCWALTRLWTEDNPGPSAPHVLRASLHHGQAQSGGVSWLWG